MTHFGLDSWSFPPLQGSSVPRAIQFAPRLVVNTVRAAVASAAEGHGVTRLFSYHLAEEIREKRLQIVLSKDEDPPVPAHLLAPARPFLGAQGARLRRLCRTPPQAVFRAAIERSQPERRCNSIATRKTVCRITSIRSTIG
jgi:DNA-binding transcriptional LysR family regulator